MGQESLDQRQQKACEIQKLMPSKIHGTRALGPKAAKSLWNPKIDAFQELRDRSPRTKGSKKLEKSKNRCLSRYMGQEPLDQRQQKTREIQKTMPFKNWRTRAPGPKAAKRPRNPKLVASEKTIQIRILLQSCGASVIL